MHFVNLHEVLYGGKDAKSKSETSQHDFLKNCFNVCKGDYTNAVKTIYYL